jgi:hypothetical protein
MTMSELPPESSSPQTAAGGPDSPAGAIDPAVHEQAKEILAVLAHTFSAMKLFPAHHASVANFQADLFRKMEEYFNQRGELKLVIRENVFEVEGAEVFEDPNILRSLPYLFHKDGMRTLSFLPGLTPEELTSFLETAKSISNLPYDVGDIVDAVWREDFAHIQFFAPDDYLINKMVGREEHKIDVDPSRFRTGQVDLDSQDTAEVYKSIQARRIKEPKENLDYQAAVSAMSESEVEHVKSLVTAQRGEGGQTDFLDMVFELLQLEDRPERFDEILAYLERLCDDWTESSDFGQAIGLIRKMHVLAEFINPISEKRARKIEELLARLRKRVSLDALQDLAREAKIPDYAAFFEYLDWIGPTTLLIGSEILETARDPEIRSTAFRFLETAGKTDPMLLANLAQDKRPLTTRAAISVLGQTNDRRFIPFLATFFTYKNKDIKLDAVRALGKIADPLAHRTLLGFLRSDPAAEIRTEAARRIRLDQDPGLLQAVIGIAGGNDFIKRAPVERAAILAGIGRSGDKPGYALIRRLLERKGFLARKKNEAIALSAVSALEAIGTPEAAEILRGAAAKRRKLVRAAAGEAFQRLSKAAGRKPE